MNRPSGRRTRRLLTAGIALAALAVPGPTHAESAYGAPYAGAETSGACPASGADATCTMTKSADPNGSVSADIRLDSEERTAGYGSASATAVVVQTHVVPAPTPRLPVTVRLSVTDAFSQAAQIHNESDAAGLSGPSASVIASVQIFHSSCAYYWRSMSRVITTSQPGKQAFNGTITVAEEFGNFCYGVTNVRAGTVTIKAGVYTFASLGAILTPDRGAAVSRASATVESITVGEYAAPEPRAATASYGADVPTGCPSPPLLTIPDAAGTCFPVQPMETSISQVSVADASGLRTAFDVRFLDAKGSDVTPYPTVTYTRLHCGTLAAPVLIPDTAAFVKIRLGDRLWPGYGVSPKCRGLAATRGAVTLGFA